MRLSYVKPVVTVHGVACFLRRFGGLEISEWKEACHPVNTYSPLRDQFPFD
jgi:hypothetical protein